MSLSGEPTTGALEATPSGQSVPYWRPTIGEETRVVSTKGVAWLYNRVPLHWRKQLKFERLVLLVSIILERSATRDDRRAAICSAYVREVFGDDSRRSLFSVLEDARAIEREEWKFNLAGNRTRLCGFTPEFAATPLSQCEISHGLWNRSQANSLNRSSSLNSGTAFS